MNQLDLNGDGIISLGEYKIALGISTQPLEAYVHFSLHFSFADSSALV